MEKKKQTITKKFIRELKSATQQRGRALHNTKKTVNGAQAIKIKTRKAEMFFSCPESSPPKKQKEP